jgi:hypothetical protein
MSEQYATGARDLILILRATKAATGRKGVGAQHYVGGHWMGCELLEVNSGTCRIRIANDDEEVLPTANVRICLAS